MRLSEVKDILNATVCVGEDKLDMDVLSACGCDMMSDVLAFVKDQSILITGLVNLQVIRTALMMDMKCIVFVRGKKPDEKLIDMAKEHELVIMTSDMRLYEACGRLYAGGLRAKGVE